MIRAGGEYLMLCVCGAASRADSLAAACAAGARHQRESGTSADHVTNISRSPKTTSMSPVPKRCPMCGREGTWDGDYVCPRCKRTEKES
jgi:hypothetical protein